MFKKSSFNNLEKEWICQYYLLIRQHREKLKRRRAMNVEADSLDKFYSDNIKNFRCAIKRLTKYDELSDPRIILSHIDGDYDSSRELYFLKADSENEVFKFINDLNLSSEYIHVRNSLYDCTGQKFGGEPIIKYICPNRYVLRYQFYYDV